MAHLIDTMAYTGETPWHELGNVLPANQPIERWAEASGMNWSIEESPVHFQVNDGSANGDILAYPDQKVLYRSDNQQPLSVVGNRYKVVQPMEVLSFYRDLVAHAGYELETAGVLKSGKKFWALARTGQSTALQGNDLVNGYLLLATSCDGTLATTATPTTIRVVCNNTLAIALDHAASAVKVPHSTHFDAEIVKSKLGIAVHQWDNFMYRMKLLSQRKVKTQEARNYFLQVLAHPDNNYYPFNDKVLAKVQGLYDGQGRGAELQAAKGTAWGLLCSVTEFIDHERRAHSRENRLNSAWFGQGANIKQRALEQAMQMAA